MQATTLEASKGARLTGRASCANRDDRDSFASVRSLSLSRTQADSQADDSSTTEPQTLEASTPSPRPIGIKLQIYTILTRKLVRRGRLRRDDGGDRLPGRGAPPGEPPEGLREVPPPVVGLEKNTRAHGRERGPPPRRREPRTEARQREARRCGGAEDEQRADAEAAVALVRPEEARGRAPRRTCAAMASYVVAAMASSWGRGSGLEVEEDAAKTVAPDLELGRQPASNDNVSDGRADGVAAVLDGVSLPP